MKFSIDPFFKSLKVIDFDIFLTLKFKYHKTSNLIDSNFRKVKFESLMKKVQKASRLNANDIIYFASEEKNLDSLYHFHVLIHVKRKANIDPEVVRKILVDQVRLEGIYKIPRRVRMTPPEDKVFKHCEIVKSSKNALRYINKVQGHYDSGKRIFYNKSDDPKNKTFFTFYRWCLKQKGLI